MIASDIWRRMPFPVRSLMKLFMKSTEEGAATSLYCATSPDVKGTSGRFYVKCQGEGAEHGRHARAGRRAVAAQRGLDRDGRVSGR